MPKVSNINVNICLYGWGRPFASKPMRWRKYHFTENLLAERSSAFTVRRSDSEIDK